MSGRFMFSFVTTVTPVSIRLGIFSPLKGFHRHLDTVVSHSERVLDDEGLDDTVFQVP
jgi:hypothetical protein